MARKKQALSADEERFLDEYLIDHNGTRAYRVAYPAAGYQTAKSNAHRLLTKAYIKDELAARRAARSKRTGVSADATLREIRRYAYSDPLDLFEADGVTPRSVRDIPLETRRAIASVKVRVERTTKRRVDGDDEVTETARIVEYKLWPKPDGLDKLCRHLGLAQEITPLEGLLGLLPPKLREQVRAALAGGLPRDRREGGDDGTDDE